MSAYMSELRLDCDYGGCKSRAAVAVHNTFNARQGQFCRRHGRARLADLRRIEARLGSPRAADRSAS